MNYTSIFGRTENLYSENAHNSFYTLLNVKLGISRERLNPETTSERTLLGVQLPDENRIPYAQDAACKACLTQEGAFSFNSIFAELLSHLFGNRNHAVNAKSDQTLYSMPKDIAKVVVSPNTLIETELQLEAYSKGPLFKPLLIFKFVVPSYVKHVATQYDNNADGATFKTIPDTQPEELTIILRHLPAIRIEDARAFVHKYCKFVFSKSTYSFHNLCHARVSFWHPTMSLTEKELDDWLRWGVDAYKFGQTPSYATPMLTIETHTREKNIPRAVASLCTTCSDDERQLSSLIPFMKSVSEKHKKLMLPCLWLDPDNYFADDILTHQIENFAARKDDICFHDTLKRYVAARPTNHDGDCQSKRLSDAASVMYGVPVASILYDVD